MKCRTIKFWLLLFDSPDSDFFSRPSALLDKEVIFLVPLLLGSPLPSELAPSREFSSLPLSPLVLEEDQLPGEVVGLVRSTSTKGRGNHGRLHGGRLGYKRHRMLSHSLPPPPQKV